MTPTLDGPFPISDLTATPTVTKTADGAKITTYPPASGVHYKTDTATLSAHPELGPYVVEPSHPLQSVWAGDNPEAPRWTVSLRFPDQKTADAVLGPLLPQAKVA